MGLNHYLINQTVQGKMVPGSRPGFGQFGVLGLAANMLKFQPRPKAKVEFDIESDRQVFNAFLKVFDGASAESVLLDRTLAARFHSTARKMGLHAPAADMNRRLINIRKNPARYKKHGIILPPATRIEAHPSIVPRYAHVIEFSLARLHSRYGVSIDDILIDPDLGLEYETMVLSAAPGLSPLEIRLAALYIRKTRYISKSREELVQSLPTEAIESAFHEVGSAVAMDLAAVPTGEGVIEVLDANKHLYISRSEDLLGGGPDHERIFAKVHGKRLLAA